MKACHIPTACLEIDARFEILCWNFMRNCKSFYCPHKRKPPLSLSAPSAIDNGNVNTYTNTPAATTNYISHLQTEGSLPGGGGDGGCGEMIHLRIWAVQVVRWRENLPGKVFWFSQFFLFVLFFFFRGKWCVDVLSVWSFWQMDFPRREGRKKETALRRWIKALSAGWR